MKICMKYYFLFMFFLFVSCYRPKVVISPTDHNERLKFSTPLCTGVVDRIAEDEGDDTTPVYLVRDIFCKDGYDFSDLKFLPGPIKDNVDILKDIHGESVVIVPHENFLKLKEFLISEGWLL